MKILAITSRYPPYHFGGYELRCRNIMDVLAARGHTILILTSQKEMTLSAFHFEAAYSIYRRLHLSYKAGDFISRMTLWPLSYPLGMLLIFMRELLFDCQDITFIDNQIKKFQPDVIYLGHITNLSRAIMPYLAACKIPIVYDEGGSGLIDSWVERGIWQKFIERFSNKFWILDGMKSIVAKTVYTLSGQKIKPQWDWPRAMRIIFNSELNRNNAISKGVPIHQATVIHSGVDTKKFTFRHREKFYYPLVLIIPGRIEPRKGQLDAVRLLAKLHETSIDAKLLLVGERWVGSYYWEIEKEIEEKQLNDSVSFLPMIEQDRLIELYHQADICLFPSYYRTGFSRVPLEAMACGCLVISYGNEGSDEIILDKKTGFLVPPGDYLETANIIQELISNNEMSRNITDAARKAIEENNAIECYVDRIEDIILNAA